MSTISRKLLGKIIDEVFDGSIEDASVIEEIYAVIKSEDLASQAEHYASIAENCAQGCEEQSALQMAIVIAGAIRGDAADDIVAEEVGYERGPRDAGEIQVKTLNWLHYDSGDASARSVVTAYFAHTDGTWCVRNGNRIKAGATLDEAKAAAHTHSEQ